MAKTKTIQLVIHNVQNEPKRIKINNEIGKGTYNAEHKTVTLKVSWDTAQEKKIRIKLRK